MTNFLRETTSCYKLLKSTKDFVFNIFHSGSECKIIFLQDVEQYLNAESRKEAEVMAVRLENIKLKNRLRKKEAALKSKVC